MSERNPLSSIQNASMLGRKVQRTYGKKTKPTAALQSAKEIFAMTENIENSLSKLHISGIEEVTTQNVAGELNSQQQISKQEQSQPVQRKESRDRGSRKGKGKKQNEETNCQEPQVLSSMAPEDEAAIQKLVKRFSDRNVLSFERYGDTISKKYGIEKIGEGSYSSVFALTRKEDVKSSSCNSSSSSTAVDDSLHRTTILKLMPILLPSRSHLDLPGQTSPSHIASELSTMRTMDPIHGFIRYRGLLVVRGSWPSSFLSAFRTFKTRHRKKAENEDPEDAFDDSQYYALIEMEDAGIEICDALKRPSDFQIYDIFWQTAIHLANAESECGFEHRDLHVSNICIKPDDISDQRMDIDKQTVATMKQPPTRILGASNISVTLIDYTFSRATLPQELHDHDFLPPINFRDFHIESHEYDDLCHEINHGKKQPTRSTELFEERIQSLTYAKVAKLVELAHTAAEREDRVYDPVTKHHAALWELHVPATNVAWLGYLITCLLGRAGKVERTRYVAGSNSVAKGVQDEMRQKLGEVRDALMVEDVESIVGSAAEVVRLGVERGWLGMSEIEWFRGQLEQES